MLHANKTNKYVITYKEIGLFFIIFSIVLFVLYPKKMLLQNIMLKQTNYNLGVIYLKNMLHKNPNNEQIMLDLVKLGLRSNNQKVIFFYLKKLKDSKSKEIQKEVYFLNYKFIKEIYFQKHNNAYKKRQTMQKLRNLFSYILKHNFYSNKNINKWYNEAIFLKKFNSAYFLLQKTLQTNPNNIKNIAALFYLSLRLHYKKDTMRYLHILQKKDIRKRQKWLMDEYYVLMDIKDYRQVALFLNTRAKNSIFWRKRLAAFYFNEKEYAKSSNQYIRLFNKSINYNNKKKFFLKAIYALRAGDLIKKASSLAHKYQPYFLNDIKIRIYLLKLYISTNSLHKAALLSKKILKLKGNKL